MKAFTTHLQAINPDTQELQFFTGPNILARNWDEAEDYCYRNGLGYLVVDGELNGETETENTMSAIKHMALN